ncbi:MAG: PIN domain-containing protein [Acidimicrobiales bacterium]
MDTSVLWPSTQRDFLLSLAVEHLYRPIWSGAILAELEVSEALKLEKQGVSRNEAVRRALHLVAEMRRAFDDAEVAGWEGLEGSYGLPDPDDEHVVAAAVVGGAGAIVTLNLKDFPVDRIPAGIDVLAPAEFAYNTVLLDPATSLRAIAEVSARSGAKGRPTRTVDEILDLLDRRYDMGDAIDVLRQAANSPLG